MAIAEDTLRRFSVLPSVAMAAQLAQAVGASLDQLAGLVGPDHQLVELARKLATVLNEQHREALADHLRMMLELAAKPVASGPPR